MRRLGLTLVERYDAVAMSYLMKNVGRSSAKESDWTNSKLATDGQTHIHLPAPVYCPDVGGQLNHPPPNRARSSSTNAGNSEEIDRSILNS